LRKNLKQAVITQGTEGFEIAEPEAETILRQITLKTQAQNEPNGIAVTT
jgi:hypothetical protein